MLEENSVDRRDTKIAGFCRQNGISEKTYRFLEARYTNMDIADAIHHNAKRRVLARKVDEWLFTQMGTERSLKVKLRLARFNQNISKLSTWRGGLGLILRPILILLGENTFWHFQKFLWKIEKQKVQWNLPSNEVAKGKDIVEQLKSDGIATWKGMFSDTVFLREAKQAANTLLEKAHEKLKELPDGIGDIYDPPTGHRFIRDASVEYCGRTRVRLGWTAGEKGEKMPNWMGSIVNERRLLQVAENFFGVPVSIKRYTIEDLLPSQTSLEWHLDTVHDCFKTYILLEDCKPENGYTQLRVGTHQLDSPSIRRTYYLMHKYGPPYHYPGPIQRVAPGEIAKGTGQAGDIIFFVPRALHAATNCKAGKRLVLIVSYTIHSNRNKILTAVGTH